MKTNEQPIATGNEFTVSVNGRILLHYYLKHGATNDEETTDAMFEMVGLFKEQHERRKGAATSFLEAVEQPTSPSDE